MLWKDVLVCTYIYLEFDFIQLNLLFNDSLCSFTCSTLHIQYKSLVQIYCENNQYIH